MRARDDWILWNSFLLDVAFTALSGSKIIHQVGRQPSPDATVRACCAAMVVMAGDAGISDHKLGSWLQTIAASIEHGDKDFHGLLN
jgi:hypothetical protein